MPKEDFKLMHLCLQLAPDDYWDETVRKDLGSALWLDFDEWWEEVNELLEVAPNPCQVIDSWEDAKKEDLWSEDMKEMGFNLAVLEVDLHYSTSHLLEEIGKTLRDLKRNRKGPSNRERRFGEYKLIRKPREAHIELIIQVWLERKYTDKVLYEIGDYLDLNRSADPTDLHGQNVLNATTSRFVKKAECLIRNAAQGKFPLY